MSGEPQLYRINPETKQSDRIEEVEFTQLGLRERRDIQEWVADNPGILGDDLLIVGKEYSGFDRTDERLDLLAVDTDGKLVIIELKRDDSGTDAHWQAIKYASYFQRATVENIVDMAATYWEKSREDMVAELLKHLGTDDLSVLNNDQRIILASHRFAPEVTSAALWLNQRTSGDDLISCVRLTPYQDDINHTLYVQASTIIPVPGADEYLVGIGHSSQAEIAVGSSLGAKLAATFAKNRNDEVSQFVKTVASQAIRGLSEDVRPDKVGRWAGDGGDRRYYHLWYSRPPWGNWKLDYSIDLYPGEEPGEWRAEVLFENRQGLALPALEGIAPGAERNQGPNGSFIYKATGSDTLSDNFGSKIAEVLRDLIEQITPIVNDFGNESTEEEEA